MVGARVHRPARALPWLMRGVDVIYDTVGTARLWRSVCAWPIRVHHRHHGVGAPARFEWTPLYFKEVELLGSNAFGVEEVRGARLHAMEHYLRLLAAGEFDPTHWLRTTFALSSTASLSNDACQGPPSCG